jgi:hypothetical protein
LEYTLNSPLSSSDPIESGEYLIDQFRVSFQSGTAWVCACREFTSSGACRHSREATGRRDAQALIKVRARVGTTGPRSHARRNV